MVRALVITAAGINCDQELVDSFALAGADVESIHLNRLIAQPALIDDSDLIGLPGGFGYGDAIAAGRIEAQLMRRHLYGRFVRAIQRGVPIFAPCNGFQVAAQIGILPGPAPGERWPRLPAGPAVTLAQNEGSRFVDRWTRCEFPASRCVWTEGLSGTEHVMVLPNAHGEGRFVADPDIIARLSAHGQIAVRYAEGENFNGSLDRIAGICDPTGLVFGLMPHPERYTRFTQHPFWTRLTEEDTAHPPIGLQMFQNAVRHAERLAERAGAPA